MLARPCLERLPESGTFKESSRRSAHRVVKSLATRRLSVLLFRLCPSCGFIDVLHELTHAQSGNGAANSTCFRRCVRLAAPQCIEGIWSPVSGGGTRRRTEAPPANAWSRPAKCCALFRRMKAVVERQLSSKLNGSIESVVSVGSMEELSFAVA